jgi:hypothetical protein
VAGKISEFFISSHHVSQNCEKTPVTIYVTQNLAEKQELSDLVSLTGIGDHISLIAEIAALVGDFQVREIENGRVLGLLVETRALVFELNVHR